MMGSRCILKTPGFGLSKYQNQVRREPGFLQLGLIPVEVATGLVFGDAGFKEIFLFP